MTVVGTVHAPARVDLHGRSAELAVERALRGAHAPGARLRIAWEELASDSPGRFREGDRILVALEPLPDLSLWRQRFPEGAALAVAGRGAAVVRDPDPASVDLLADFLALPPASRDTEAGARALAAIAAGAEPGLAGSALARLASLEGAWAEPGSPALDTLARTLGDEQRPLVLRREVLGLAAKRRIEGLRPAIEPLAREGHPLEPDALDALGRLAGALPEARVRELLARPDAGIRAVAVRQSGSALAVDELAGLLGPANDARVRAAAVAVLAARGDGEALAKASPGLFDADVRVRAEAITQIGARGKQAVPLLLGLALDRSSPEAGGPVAALALAGPAGHEALGEIASRHPDPKVRDLARIALGRPLEAH